MTCAADVLEWKTIGRDRRLKCGTVVVLGRLPVCLCECGTLGRATPGLPREVPAPTATAYMRAPLRAAWIAGR